MKVTASMFLNYNTACIVRWETILQMPPQIWIHHSYQFIYCRIKSATTVYSHTCYSVIPQWHKHKQYTAVCSVSCIEDKQNGHTSYDWAFLSLFPYLHNCSEESIFCQPRISEKYYKELPLENRAEFLGH